MLRKCLQIVLLMVIYSFFSGCSNPESKQQNSNNDPQLLIYCGITMVKPMRAIADVFEKDNHCQVILHQGGSEDLYQSLKASQKGDLFLPGSEGYRTNHLSEGLLGEFEYLGYNQASFLVQKGNPKGITGDLQWLLSKDLAVAIGNPESCSIGKQTKKVLVKAGMFDQVAENSFSLVADSRNLNNLLKDKTVDLLVNWRATAFFEDNRPSIDVIELDHSISPRKKILLNMLTFSKQQDLSRKFMEFAASSAGQRVFREFGFLDASQSGSEKAGVLVQ